MQRERFSRPPTTGEGRQSIADEPATTVTTEPNTVEEPTTGEGRQSIADEPATTVTTELQTVEEPTTGEAATGDGPVTDEIRVAVEPLPPSTMIELTEFTDDTTMYCSNSGYLYAGQIIEAATGQDAAEVFAERIYEPLGLTSTCWPSHDPNCETDVPGVMDTTEVGGDGRNALVEEFVAVDSLAHSAGVLISTVEDLDRFVTALFNSELAGTDEFLASTTDPQYQIPRASIVSILMSAYGLGVMVFYDGTVGHDGQTIGFMSSVRYNPATNESTIILVNDTTTTSTDLILEQVLSTGTAPTAGDVVSFR